MSTQLTLRRGNTAQTLVFTGASAEPTVDTDRNLIVIHDGVTPGGHPAAKLTFANSAFNQANAAFDKANTAATDLSANLILIEGVNTTQNTNISGKVSKAGDTMTGTLNLVDASASGNVSVTGNISARYVNLTHDLEANNLIVNHTLYSGLATRAATPLPNLIAQFTGNTDSYVQVNAQNIDEHGSADYVATADVGSDTTFYVDFGIQNSEQDFGNIKRLDGYVYVQGNTGQIGGNLVIGTASGTAGQQIRFVSGGLEDDNVIVVLESSTSEFKNNVIVNGTLSGTTITNMQNKTQASFDAANSATSNAAAASSYANAAFNHANAAFNAANSIPIVDSYARDTANSAGAYANGAFVQANAAFDKANSSFTINGQTIYLGNTVTLNQLSNGSYNLVLNSDGSLSVPGAISIPTGSDFYFNAPNAGAPNYWGSVNIIWGAGGNSASLVFNKFGAQLSSTEPVTLSANNYTLVLTKSGELQFPNGTKQTTAYSGIVFDAANSAGNYANSAFDAANSASNYANGAFAKANAAYDSQNTTGSYANSAYAEANTAYSAASNAYNFATSVNVYAYGAFTQANLAFDAANSAGSYANAAFAAANNVAPQIQPTFNQANAAFDKANAAYESQNTTGTYANSAFGAANSAGSYANSAFGVANSASVYANGAFTQANAAYNQANTATNNASGASSYANGAFAQANAAFNKANTSVQTSGINSITSGSLTITNTGGIGLTVTGNAVFNNDISVQGNVFIGGNATSFGANNITVEDSLIFLANNNNQDLVDIGFVAHFNPGAGQQHTGLVRDASDDTWKFFSNVYPNPTTTIDFTNAVYDPVRMGDLTASSATINGVNLLPYTQSAFGHANAAYGSQNTTGTYANSAFAAANSAGSYANGAFTQANAAYNQANTATTNAATADSKAVTAGSYANSAFAQANTAVTNASAASSYANSAFLKANNALANTSGAVFNGELKIGGGGKLTVLPIGGDEGGEILLDKPPNGTLGGGVTIDAYQNKIRIFEQGGSARGVFIDLTEASAGVATNLLNQSNIVSNTFTTGASTSQVTVDAFSTSSFRSAKYEAQMTAGTSYHVIELRVVHDGTTVWLAQYGEIFTGSSLGTFDASITSGVLNLQFTPASATVTTIKVLRTSIAV